MKKFLVSFLFAISAFANASPAAGDVQILQYINSFQYLEYLVNYANGNCLFYLDSSVTQPRCATIGSGLAISSGALGITTAFTPVNADWTSVSGLSQILNKPSIPAAQVSSDWTASTGVSAILNKPAVLSLTTIGTTGAATYNGSTGILNIPSYTSSSGTVTSIIAGTGLSGGTITTSGTISMPNTGTAGTYSGVTTDSQGRVTVGTTLSINDNPGRSLVTSTSSTGYQISSTRNSRGCYEGAFSTTSTIGGPSSASVFLETADTNSTTPSDWTTKATQTYSNTITLAIVLNQVQGNNWSFCRDIPSGKFVRLRSGSISGTASASLNSTQQESTY